MRGAHAPIFVRRLVPRHRDAAALQAAAFLKAGEQQAAHHPLRGGEKVDRANPLRQAVGRRTLPLTEDAIQPRVGLCPPRPIPAWVMHDSPCKAEEPGSGVRCLPQLASGDCRQTLDRPRRPTYHEHTMN
jgi:hypothetical protein